MLRVTHAQKAFGSHQVLVDATIEIVGNDRIALVGRNGAGKTTLLKILLGEEHLDGGNRFVQPGTEIGWLPQDAGIRTDRTLWDEMQTAFPELVEVRHELEEVEQKLGDNPDMDEMDRLIERQGDLYDRIDQLDGYQVDARIHTVLAGLGFSQDDNDKLTKDFSGGWQMRVALAKLLVRKPEILLLDEPTNHLDLAAIAWLEEHLQTYSGAALIVSHDRYFLDRVAKRTVEMIDGKLNNYKGNYSAYLAERARRRAILQTAFERQQKFLQKQQQFIARFRANANRAAQARAREKLLSKMAKVAAPAPDAPSFNLRFPPIKNPSGTVATIRGVNKSFRRPVLRDITFAVERGERLALIGPNGGGKSTLLKMIAGVYEPDSGEISIADNVQVGYFAQDQSQTLDTERTVIEEVMATAPAGWNEERARGLLGRFLFSQNEVEKKIGALSGGEKSRLSLAKLMMKPSGLLLLDEPTNHFDVPAKEAIEAALESYPGTVIVASHDRYFLDKVVKKIGEVEDGRLNIFLGNWTEFTEQRIGAGAGLLRGADINDEPEYDETDDAESEAQEEELSAAIADLADLEVRLETAETADRMTLLLERERLEKRVQELEDAWLKVSFDEPVAEPAPEPVTVKEPAKSADARGADAKPAKSGKKKK